MSRERVLHITIHDCDVQTFRCGGKGGQNKDKRDTGVRIIHRASGARGESREARTQGQNKKIAWRRMAESSEMQKWLRIAHAQAIVEMDRELRGQQAQIVAQDEIESWIDKEMRSENLLIEYGV
jgi:protein subunit release factor B